MKDQKDRLLRRPSDRVFESGTGRPGGRLVERLHDAAALDEDRRRFTRSIENLMRRGMLWGASWAPGEHVAVTYVGSTGMTAYRYDDFDSFEEIRVILKENAKTAYDRYFKKAVPALIQKLSVLVFERRIRDFQYSQAALVVHHVAPEEVVTYPWQHYADLDVLENAILERAPGGDD